MKKEGIFALRVYPVLFMVLLTMVFITLVSGIHIVTKERVQLNEALNLRRAVLFAADIPFPEDDIDRILAIYDERVREVGEIEGRPAYFEILEDGEITGYAAYIIGAGLWGRIVAVFGFSEDLEEISGVEFLEQNETPGLGARITETWYKEQFRGKQGPFTLVPEGTADAPDELDAITGATRTSEAVLQIANRAGETARDVVESNRSEM
jgi:Na+-transporting NADH:ubiquinone oxidoreductase subunit C